MYFFEIGNLIFSGHVTLSDMSMMKGIPQRELIVYNRNVHFQIKINLSNH